MPKETVFVCALCGQARRVFRRQKLLYDWPVCSVCRGRFAGRRRLAFVIDSLLCLAVVAAAIVIVVNADPTAKGAPGVELILAAIFGSLVFFLFKDGFGGYSPGKKVMGVRVVDCKTLEPIGLIASLGRNAIPVFFPVTTPVIGIQLEEGYRLGDGLGRSKVIWLRYAEHPVFTGPPVGAGALADQGEFAPWRVELPRAQKSTNPYRPPQQ